MLGSAWVGGAIAPYAGEKPGFSKNPGFWGWRHIPKDLSRAEADVLYINFQQPAIAATDSEVTDDDIVIRYANHEVIGLTILSVSQR